MLEKITSLIEKNRNSNKFTWKFLVFVKDFIWKLCLLKDYHLRGRLVLKKLIKNNRILIIGSGPSARELDRIQEGARIFICNRSFMFVLIFLHIELSVLK